MTTVDAGLRCRSRTACSSAAQFVDGRRRSRRSTTLNPHDGSVLASVAQAGPADVDRAVAAAAEAFPAWARTARRRPAAGCCSGWPTRSRPTPTSWPGSRALDTGHPIRDSRGLDVPRTAATFRYFGGMADKIQGSVIPVEPGFLNYVLREPLGVVGEIVPVELPADVLQLEDGPGARGRQHGRAQAGRAHPAVSSLRVGRADGRGRLPARGRQHRARDPDGRRASTWPRTRASRKIAFTGSTAVGRRDRRGLRRQPEAGPARARRQGRQHRLRRRRPRRRRQRLGLRDLPQPGPGLHRRLAAHPPRDDRRRVPRPVHRAGRVDPPRRPARPGDRDGPADLRRSPRPGPRLSSRSPEPRAARS